MSLFLFTRKILAGEPIEVFNFGEHARDFTYIDDIVEGVVRTLDKVATPDPAWSGAHPDPATSSAPYRLYNIGNNQPVELLHFIACIEKATGRKAEMKLLPLQPGDVPRTYADIDALTEATGFAPQHPDRGRRAPLRRLVPRLLRGLSRHPCRAGLPQLIARRRAAATGTLQSELQGVASDQVQQCFKS